MALMLLMSWVYVVEILAAPTSPPARPGPGTTAISAAYQLTARHQAALTLLRQGRAPEAAAAFAAAVDFVLSSAELDATSKSRFLYNYGVALRESGRPADAVEAFLKSRQLDPGFSEPVKATLALSKVFHGPLPSFDALVETVIFQGDLGSSRALLESVFTKAGSTENPALADREIDLLAQFLTAAALGPGEFRAEWQPLLARARRAMSPRTAAKAELLEIVYLTEFPVIIEVSSGHQFTRSWQASSAESQIFSGLLQAVGDRVASDGVERSAVALFALSWSSAENLDAAVHLAALLQQSSLRLDADGRILRALIHELFSGKGEAILQGDWPNTFRFHVVLAGIFEEQRQWGNKAEPASAIFQLGRAIRASEHLSVSAEAAREAVPALLARLGRAYVEAKQPERALDEFLRATKGYLASARPEAAETVLLRAQGLADEIGSVPARKTIAELEDKVRKQQRARSSATPLTDSRITESILAKLAADPDIRPGALKVESSGGEVTVSGEVANEQEAFEIDRLVRSTSGVLRYRQALRPRTPTKHR